MPSLFEQVVDCCQLAPAFARRIISEALERTGVSAEELRPQDLIRALPRIRQTLGVFLDPSEVNRTIGCMRALARTSWTDLPAVSSASNPPEEAAPPKHHG
ncbi:hypothetical protein [Chondromyces apiculatus]|uniref:Uncharacterized protein n=1 Tax=Chondromyces apiculatus DSM 436 TaxID=1192034 RepID=A0A017SYE1_9BACT|nr:hypothetical protein [Chondromyces apiculatus]EYF01994.1 Hypothetical protein CAP_7612 [Chondromyces apiculatus DSM 436]